LNIYDEIRGGSGKLIYRRGSGQSGYTSIGSGSDHATGVGRGTPGKVKRYSEVLKEQQQDEEE
jgi:hypothetical protein